MRQGRPFGLSADQRADLWLRWKAGESLHEIGRALDKDHGSIQFVLAKHGGLYLRFADARAGCVDGEP